MKYQAGDLVKFDRPRPRLPRPRLRLRLRLRLRPRPRPGELGIIVEAIKKEDAREDCEAGDPNCYIVHWFEKKERSLMYEDEVIEQ